MNQTLQESYADLILWCVDGVENQNVHISCEAVHRELARKVAERAYGQGAGLVIVEYEDPGVVAARIANASDDALTAFAGYQSTMTEEMAQDGWTRIRIAGQEDPEALAALDAERIGRYMGAYRRLMNPIRMRVSRFEMPWVGVLMPTPAVAVRAYPDLNEVDALARFEEAIVRVLHLDGDPIAFWQGEFARLIERQDRLNSLALDRLRFTGPGTDLEIGLHPDGRFMAAEETLPCGKTVRVNMPSCEVFTTPDARRTTGRVQTTRPFQSTSAPGQTVRGAWFEFADGAVVDFGADAGKEILQRVLEMDGRARYLGEVALVDAGSPVAREGITFGHMLYDENAACHIALGSGFPRLIPGAEKLSTDDQIEKGINYSVVHDDMMIGGDQVDVTGITADGTRIPIISQGRFTE